jgi:hypothetical protein
MPDTFKCCLCNQEYQTNKLEYDEAELDMQDCFGKEYDLEECEQICEHCFRKFWIEKDDFDD